MVHNAKTVLTLTDKKRFAAFVQILIVIEQKAKRNPIRVEAVVVQKRAVNLPPRDSAGRFMKNSKQAAPQRSKIRLAKDTQDLGGPSTRIPFRQHLYLRATPLSLQLYCKDIHDRYYSSYPYQRHISTH